MGKMERIPAWQLTKVKNKSEVIEGMRVKPYVHFASLMDLCQLKKFGVGTTISEIQRSSCTPR